MNQIYYYQSNILINNVYIIIAFIAKWISFDCWFNVILKKIPYTELEFVTIIDNYCNDDIYKINYYGHLTNNQKSYHIDLVCLKYKIIHSDLNGAINIMRKFFLKNNVKLRRIVGDKLYNPIKIHTFVNVKWK